jgi:hypothetical protein
MSVLAGEPCRTGYAVTRASGGRARYEGSQRGADKARPASSADRRGMPSDRRDSQWSDATISRSSRRECEVLHSRQGISPVV